MRTEKRITAYKSSVQSLHERRGIEYLCVADVKYRYWNRYRRLDGSSRSQCRRLSFEEEMRKLAVVRCHETNNRYFVLLHTRDRNAIDFSHIRNNLPLHRYATDTSFRARGNSSNCLIEANNLSVKHRKDDRIFFMEETKQYNSMLRPTTVYEIEIERNADGMHLERILKSLVVEANEEEIEEHHHSRQVRYQPIPAVYPTNYNRPISNIPLERSDRYEGIKGTFELITVTEREPDLTVDVTNAQGGDIATPTEAPTLTEEPTPTGQSQGCRRNQAVDEQPDKERKLQRPSLDDFNGFQSGVITQKVFLVTNQRLPHGPKAV